MGVVGGATFAAWLMLDDLRDSMRAMSKADELTDTALSFAAASLNQRLLDQVACQQAEKLIRSGAMLDPVITAIASDTASVLRQQAAAAASATETPEFFADYKASDSDMICFSRRPRPAAAT